MFATIYGLGIAGGFVFGRAFPNMHHKMLVYGAITHSFFLTGILTSFYVDYARLTGYWDNGLRWNVPDYHVKKFDCTSKFEENTIFHRFRVRTD
jgi:hypothetical protein